MSASARGTVDAPGRKVKQKAGLNRGILDAAWAEFRRQLEYKTAASGGRVVAVDPAFTSQRCSECGHLCMNNRRTQSAFICLACGHAENADMNAAKNILAAGHAATACGEDVRRAKPARDKRAASAKQEPTEATTAGSACCGAVGIPRLKVGEDVNGLYRCISRCAAVAPWPGEGRSGVQAGRAGRCRESPAVAGGARSGRRVPAGRG